MIAIRRKGILWYLFRAPIYIYRWHLEWLFGKRLLLLGHAGRRSGLRRHTVLEVVEYRKEGPEIVVANGFGPDSDWVRNIQAKPDEDVKIGSERFAASHRFLDQEEAAAVIRGYEYRNRFIAPIVRVGFAGCSVGNITPLIRIGDAWSVKSPYLLSAQDLDILITVLRLCSYVGFVFGACFSSQTVTGIFSFQPARCWSDEMQLLWKSPAYGIKRIATSHGCFSCPSARGEIAIVPDFLERVIS